MGKRLQGKIAMVTGGGRGIGQAIATRFAEEGAKVAILEIDPLTAQATAQAIESSGGVAIGLACDVTHVDSIDQALAVVQTRFGAPSVLVNNAGANVFFEPLAMPEEAWAKCMKLDLEAAWLCARAVLPSMLERNGGSIINIASTHSFQIIPHSFPYPVAKHGLIGLTRALALEYAASGIRVNAIAPGYIETTLVKEYYESFADPEAVREATRRLQPPRRIGQPVEVANTAVFLASDEATFINAETITIDGGRSALFHD